ncbi:MAG: integrase [Proteobacteria bacterium SG_bin6]|nr:MAG: integrase [Proteobacteria bacterium SG_bin6]
MHILLRRDGIARRLTKIKRPWTNGQVERMSRTIKEATAERYPYDGHAQLTAHLHDFINAYNYGRRLKTLRGLTSYKYICKCRTSELNRFTLDPHHQLPGPNISARAASA